MRICLDLDGVICTVREPHQHYSQVSLIPGAAETIQRLRASGHIIIIHTARHMKTCDGNLGLVMARIAQTTLDWLTANGIEYDEIHFGKPWADLYIDDNAIRFHDWNQIGADIASAQLGRT